MRDLSALRGRQELGVFDSSTGIAVGALKAISLVEMIASFFLFANKDDIMSNLSAELLTDLLKIICIREKQAKKEQNGASTSGAGIAAGLLAVCDDLSNVLALELNISYFQFCHLKNIFDAFLALEKANFDQIPVSMDDERKESLRSFNVKLRQKTEELFGQYLE